MENLQYISFVQGATSSGTLAFLLETYDLAANISLNLSVSGIAGNETPTALAFKVQTQLETALVQNGYDFDGTLYYADQTRTALFDVNRTEQVVSVFSQSSFAVSVVSNSVGAEIVCKDIPLFVTLAEINTQARLKGPYQDYAGNNLSTADLIDLMTSASASLCSYLNNNIVWTTYVDTEVCKGTKSVFTRKYPLRDFYSPMIRRPYGMGFVIQSSYSMDPDVKANFAVDANRREIYYRFSQDFFTAYEPFDDGNEMLLAYTAGYEKIPTAIKQAVFKFVEIVQFDPTTKSYKVEGFEHTYNSPNDIFKSMNSLLAGYSLYGF